MKISPLDGVFLQAVIQSFKRFHHLKESLLDKSGLWTGTAAVNIFFGHVKNKKLM
jgi:hypothetical protein